MIKIRKSGLYVAVFILGIWAASTEASRPNIIFLMADDMGYGDPRCYNEKSVVPTVGMDQLAKEGMMFTDAHSPSSVCTPTRYSVLTGRYCWRSRLKKGVLRERSPMLIEKGRMTVASMLQNQGYYTACIGKWHLGLTDTAPDFTKEMEGRMPMDVGFDYFFGAPGTPWYYFPPYGKKNSTPEMLQSCHFIENRNVLDDMNVDQKLIHKIIREKAVEVIGQHAQQGGEKPLFLYLPLSAPHNPWVASYESEGKTGAGDRADMVLDVDLTVRAVMEVLDRNHMRDNTLLIVTSDNGSTLPGGQSTEWDLYHSTGDLRGMKGSIFEAGHRVPFLVRWPGKVPAGVKNDETICLVDFMKTCAAITGADLLSDAAEDSYNILPAMLATPLEAPIREATVHHSVNGLFSIRQGKWKYLEANNGGGFETRMRKEVGDKTEETFQLYDLEADPHEDHNLYTEYPEVVQKLSGLLDKYRTSSRSAPRSIFD